MINVSHKKALLISWHFPPHKSSSSFNLFKRIKDTGYQYDVLYANTQVLFANESVFRFARSKFNCYGLEVSSEDARKPAARTAYIDHVLSCYQQLVDKNHYQVMLSHSHEFVSHLAAMEIKKINPELRWVASFGDPIAANPYNESYKFPMLAEDSQAESEVISRADRIIVTNSYQQAAMTESQSEPVNSDKFYIVPHCFDDRMYPMQDQQDVRASAQVMGKAVFRFMHVGMLYTFKRTAEPFMLGAQCLLQKHPEAYGRFTLEFYGANDKYIQAAADYGLEGIASFKGTVSYMESLALMCEADCLLLRDADFSDQGLGTTPFYPGKLADYLGAKKQIVAVTMVHGCVPDMLAQIGGAYCTEKDINGIADAMWAAINGQLTVNTEEANHYSYRQTAERARKALSFPQEKQTILIAGHDLKFAKFIMEAIRDREDLELLVDQWQGHNKHDEEQSNRLLNQADTIFCEWGLGNAVWYSRNKREGQKLIVRAHAQELKTRHLDQCEHNNIDQYIFVSPYYFELMISSFSLQREKCRVIFNMVDTELLNQAKISGSEFNLGMIGDVPRLKRLDRALDIFEKLYAIDKRYKLYIKGKRPEDYPWMKSNEKAGEMTYYQKQYQRIKSNSWHESVAFDEFGPVDQWLKKIGWILSVSDHESFHLAVAEGMASGAEPLILRWDGSQYIYPKQYIYSNKDEIVHRVIKCNPRVHQSKKDSRKFDKNVAWNQFIEIF